jgi:type II secretory pathway component PulF
VSRSARELVSASHAATLADALADTVRRRGDRRELRALAERWRSGPQEVEIAEGPEDGDGDVWEQAIAVVAKDPELSERWLEGRYQIAEMRAQLRSASAYPLMLGLVAMVAFCLLGLSLQRLDRVIAQGIDEQLMIGAGRLASSTSGLILTVAPSVGLLVLLGWGLIRLIAGRQAAGWSLANLPGIGAIFRATGSMELFRTAAILQRAGWDLPRALEAGSKLCDAPFAPWLGRSMAEAIGQGATLGQAIATHQWFPLWMAAWFHEAEQAKMTAAGAMDRMADYLQLEVGQSGRAMATWMPLLIFGLILLGLPVGYFGPVIQYLSWLRALSGW